MLFPFSVLYDPVRRSARNLFPPHILPHSLDRCTKSVFPSAAALSRMSPAYCQFVLFITAELNENFTAHVSFTYLRDQAKRLSRRVLFCTVLQLFLHLPRTLYYTVFSISIHSLFSFFAKKREKLQYSKNISSLICWGFYVHFQSTFPFSVKWSG